MSNKNIQLCHENFTITTKHSVLISAFYFNFMINDDIITAIKPNLITLKIYIIYDV